jgi:hypothetical protein
MRPNDENAMLKLDLEFISLRGAKIDTLKEQICTQ